MKDVLPVDNAISNEADDPDQRRSPENNQFWRRFLPFLFRHRTQPLETGIGEKDAYLPNQMMVENITQLHEVRVDDVMIARSEIEAIEMGASLSEALLLFEKSGHSRLPVYVETLDDPRGMVHIRDLLSFIIQTARCVHAQDSNKTDATSNEISLDFTRVNLEKTIGEIGIIREVLFVPASMRTSQLLLRMQTTRTQMALVIDEYGGTDGLASMEDVFELVVGDIEDEHDDEDVMIVTESSGCWLIDARAELEEVADLLDDDIDWGELGEDVDTIGGLIVSKLDHIPKRGEMVVISGYAFHVIEADHRRIRRVRMRKL